MTYPVKKDVPQHLAWEMKHLVPALVHGSENGKAVHWMTSNGELAFDKPDATYKNSAYWTWDGAYIGVFLLPYGRSSAIVEAGRKFMKTDRIGTIQTFLSLTSSPYTFDDKVLIARVTEENLERRFKLRWAYHNGHPRVMADAVLFREAEAMIDPDDYIVRADNTRTA
ncbi:MAG: hypothetical protein WAZ18_02690 [Alphaproteobacteria bacterium]